MRIAAVLIAMIAVAMVALPPRILERMPQMATWIGFVLAAAAAAALLGLAALIRRENAPPAEVTASFTRQAQQLMELQQKLNDLHMMSVQVPPMLPPVNSGPKDYTSQFERLAAMIEEVREISLLPDADRRLRLDVQRQQRKGATVKEVFGVVAAHDWSKAERLLIMLEAEFPNDSDVAKARSYLDHSRRLFESDTMSRAMQEVEELMAASEWDRALQRAQQFVQGFPTSGDAQALVSRVQREYEFHRSTSAQQLFEQIRMHIDRRMWRAALGRARTLLAQFPEHKLSETIRQQLPTLNDNAEIEERQELEVRIQELFRGGDFDQAIELAEDVILRYPNSPQAESLKNLLPRIRELAQQSFEGGVQPMGA